MRPADRLPGDPQGGGRGGGRGMAVVREPGGLVRAYNDTRAHARAVFGDERLYMERFVDGARHVEVQVLADGYGTTVHLGERDCSVQRRHQKMVEESPAPNLPPERRRAICEAAVRGARSVGYVGRARSSSWSPRRTTST
ncbi:hypothetical protein NKH77_41625 [Streptomyces sp. M19]